MALLQPKVRADLTYHEVAFPEEERTIVYVRDALRSYIVGLNEMQVEMMRLCDGIRTHAEIASALEEKYEVEIPVEKVDRFVKYLRERMLLDVACYDVDSPEVRTEIARALSTRGLYIRELPRVDGADPARKFLFEQGVRLAVRDPGRAASYLEAALDVDPQNTLARDYLAAIHEGFFLAHRTTVGHMKMVHLWNPDAFLTKVDRAIGDFVFGRGGLAVLALSIVAIIPAAIFAAPTPLSEIHGIDVILFFLFVLLPQYVVHELFGHGLACKHYGGRVEDTGAMLMYGVVPGAYTNVLDVVRLRTKSQKIVVYLAGVAMQTPLLALFWLVYWLAPSFPLHQAIWLWLFVSLYLIGKNLVPTMIGMDAYFVLELWLDLPNLAEDAAAYVTRRAKKIFLGVADDAPPPPPRTARIFVAFDVLRRATTLGVAILILAYVVPMLWSWSRPVGVAVGALYIWSAFVKPLVSTVAAAARIAPVRTALTGLLAAAVLLVDLPSSVRAPIADSEVTLPRSAAERGILTVTSDGAPLSIEAARVEGDRLVLRTPRTSGTAEVTFAKQSLLHRWLRALERT